MVEHARNVFHATGNVVSSIPCMPGNARSVFGDMGNVVPSAACMLGARKTLRVFRFACTERLKRQNTRFSAYTERFNG